MRAPFAAAVRTPAMARARLSAASAVQRIWTRPTGTVRDGGGVGMPGK